MPRSATRAVTPASELTERQLQKAVIEMAKPLGWRIAWTWNSLHSPKRR